MSIQAQVLIAGTPTQSAAADNAVATATVAAIAGMTHYILGVSADFDIAVSAIVTITILQGSTALVVYEWDFTNGAFHFAFPTTMKGVVGGAVSATLAASGTGGTSGRITLYTFPN